MAVVALASQDLEVTATTLAVLAAAVMRVGLAIRVAATLAAAGRRSPRRLSFRPHPSWHRPVQDRPSQRRPSKPRLSRRRPHLLPLLLVPLVLTPLVLATPLTTTHPPPDDVPSSHAPLSPCPGHALNQDSCQKMLIFGPGQTKLVHDKLTYLECLSTVLYSLNCFTGRAR